MKKYLNSATMAVALLLAMAFPAFADVAPTKTALVEMISKETEKTGVKHSDIVRMVNASFIEGKKRNIDPFLIVSLMNTESKFRPWAKSVEGARGLMQVIPRWHQDKIRGRNINHIETNIEVGTQVLADCLDRRKGNLTKALHCYSSGARHYAAKLKTGYQQARTADLIHRFKNNLPLVVVAKFEEPRNFYVSPTHYTTLTIIVRFDDNDRIMLAALSP